MIKYVNIPVSYTPSKITHATFTHKQEKAYAELNKLMIAGYSIILSEVVKVDQGHLLHTVLFLHKGKRAE